MSGSNISNPIDAHYILRGINSSIYQLSLDKDYYQKGEQGEISFVWSAPSTKYIRGGSIKGTEESVKLNVSIKNDKGIECIKPIEKILNKDIDKPQVKISFSVQSDCMNPHVSTTLTDNTGKVLDQKNFDFKTSLTTKNIQNHKTNYLMLIVIIIVLISFAIYLKKKNRSIEKK